MKSAGQCALVTGASRGIGKAIALALGSAGVNVAVNYLTRNDAAAGVVAQIQKSGAKAIAVKADVRNPDQVRAMVDRISAELGPVDILVNNAGLLRDNLLTFMTEEEWDDVMDTSLKGAYHCIKAVARQMARKKSGRIINISSDAGVLGDMMRANYSSAKAGLLGLTRTAARELAASGITVNAVVPGVVETDMIHDMNDVKRGKLIASIPAGRFGTPEEIASVVMFLASEDAAYITGHALRVDGGMAM